MEDVLLSAGVLQQMITWALLHLIQLLCQKAYSLYYGKDGVKVCLEFGKLRGGEEISAYTRCVCHIAELELLFVLCVYCY